MSPTSLSADSQSALRAVASVVVPEARNFQRMRTPLHPVRFPNAHRAHSKISVSRDSSDADFRPGQVTCLHTVALLPQDIRTSVGTRILSPDERSSVPATPTAYTSHPITPRCELYYVTLHHILLRRRIIDRIIGRGKKGDAAGILQMSSGFIHPGARCIWMSGAPASP